MKRSSRRTHARRSNDSSKRKNYTRTPLEKLVALLKRPVTEDAQGFTRAELCEATGLSDETVLGRLRELSRQGKLDVGRKRILSIDGRGNYVPAYRIKNG